MFFRPQTTKTIVLTYDSLARREFACNISHNDSRYIGVNDADWFTYETLLNPQSNETAQIYCFLYPGSKEMLRWLLEKEFQIPLLKTIFFGAGIDISNQIFIFNLLTRAIPDQPQLIEAILTANNRIFSSGSLTIGNLKNLDKVTENKNAILIEDNGINSVVENTKHRTLFHTDEKFISPEINLNNVGHILSIGNVFVITGILNDIFNCISVNNLSLPESLSLIINNIETKQISKEYYYHTGFEILQAYNPTLQRQIPNDINMTENITDIFSKLNFG